MSLDYSSIVIGIATGLLSSSLVVLYFEHRDRKRHTLSRAHLIERFKATLFGVLTTVRTAANIEPPKSRTEKEIFTELENVLGRYNPDILLSGLTNLSEEKHGNLILNLTNLQNASVSLFSDSLAHKTLEDKIVSSIAELQDWIEGVLSLYAIFPEIKNDPKRHMELVSMWHCNMSNLAENTFAILGVILEDKTYSQDDLRWGSRSIK